MEHPTVADIFNALTPKQQQRVQAKIEKREAGEWHVIWHLVVIVFIFLSPLVSALICTKLLKLE